MSGLENTVLEEKFNAKYADKSSDGVEVIQVQPEKLVEFVTYLKMHSNTQYDVLFSASGVDRLEFFEAVYHLYSTVFNKKLIIKVKLPKDEPAVDSLTSVYEAADWHERETFDLFGIKFNNHPNMERLLMPKDWIGHPLRKNYVLNDKRLIWNER